MNEWKPKMARTRVEGFQWKSGLPSQRMDGQCDPVKGGRRSTGERSPDGTRERKAAASHHRVY